MVTRRTPRFSFSNEQGPALEHAWSRARTMHDHRSYVVAGPTALTVKPGGIRATRTVRRDGTRRTTPPVRGWRR